MPGGNRSNCGWGLAKRRTSIVRRNCWVNISPRQSLLTKLMTPMPSWICCTTAAVEPVIPPLRCRTVRRRYSKRKYKQRNLVERFINRLKHYRRVATRYEKTARNFLAFTQLASTLVTLGVNVNTT